MLSSAPELAPPDSARDYSTRNREDLREINRNAARITNDADASEENLFWLVGGAYSGDWRVPRLSADLCIFFRSIRQIFRQGVSFQPDADLAGIYTCQHHGQRWQSAHRAVSGSLERAA